MVEVGKPPHPVTHRCKLLTLTKCISGWSPLHEAVLSNRYAIAETLLKAGAQIDPLGHEGVTPLHDAVVLGHFKIIDLLLKHGADPLLKNENGDTAIDLSEDTTIQNLLRKYVPKTKRNLSSAQSVSSTTSFAESRRVRQASPGGEAGTKLQSSETETQVDPDTGGTTKAHDSSTASPKVKPSAQSMPPLRQQAMDSDIHGYLLVQDQETLGSATLCCTDSDAESDVTVDYTGTHSSSPEHWALGATQEFSAAMLSSNDSGE
ncbi:ankyrin repeat domain-containing protein 31 isoform X1 [Electrophorus electricus]|uniref:ankyrin repeat domain-containing protein 31 isoform X1 n=1 Tax=Electrophorus electricus TaxID=8005 RepID=UPI0015CFE3FA|nr:ankyrin repeat domain-containing protein 31 isoform X1 [Electrophorus electricus]